MTTNTTNTTNTEEQYNYDEPTPADEIIHTENGPVIMRIGEPPIPVNCGANNAKDLTNK
jgi:hypothetical protein